MGPGEGQGVGRKHEKEVSYTVAWYDRSDKCYGNKRKTREM